MRDILFKAKRNDNGEWVEGYLVRFCDRYGGLGFEIIAEAGIYYDGSPNYISHEVDENTICQYTGLTDKNGQKIWENDVLFAKEPYIPTCPFSIRYNQETISHVGLYDEFGKEFELSKELLSCSEVIGNIFDNTELLEV